MSARVTRLAPSPTGRMHLGHAFSFLCAWALARRAGWKVLLRLEDLDAQRVTPEAEADTLWMFEWLGIDWDGPIVRQSERGAWYRECMTRLAGQGVVFESTHSRAQLREASAPNEGDAVVRFPRELRPTRDEWHFVNESVNHRLAVEPAKITVTDELRGAITVNPAAVWGDPLIWLKSGVPSYQLAVAADDLAMGVTDVVRGEDLLESAPLQLHIRRLLGGDDSLRWWHVPLIRDESGRRLAKRHDDLAISTLAARGETPDGVRGLVAQWLGAIPAPQPLSIASFLDLDVRSLLTSKVWPNYP